MANLHSLDTEVLKSFCKEKKYSFKQYGKNPQVVLIGEWHNRKEFQDAQESLIEIIKPKVVLHEGYDPNSRKEEYISWYVSKGYSREEVKNSYAKYEQNLARFFQWKKKFGLTLLPGDISIVRYHRLQDGLENLLKNEKVYSLKMSRNSKLKTNAQRIIPSCYLTKHGRTLVNAYMGIKIRDAVDTGKSPIVGIYGAKHICADSDIHDVLQGRSLYLSFEKISYITINQATKANSPKVPKQCKKELVEEVKNALKLRENKLKL